jgi:Zn-dependent peptidase ImmA (M78 family)
MRRDEIESRAAQTLKDHGLLQIPVDPIRIAHALNIPVLSAVFAEPDKSGAVVSRDGRFSIFVSANDPPARKRFTIAHEIGHRLLHMAAETESDFVDTPDNYRSTGLPEEQEWTPERRREWEANTFASALLMPASIVREQWELCKDTAILAWKFQVSITAMAVRLGQLGLLQESV